MDPKETKRSFKDFKKKLTFGIGDAIASKTAAKPPQKRRRRKQTDSAAKKAADESEKYIEKLTNVVPESFALTSPSQMAQPQGW